MIIIIVIMMIIIMGIMIIIVNCPDQHDGCGDVDENYGVDDILMISMIIP